MTNYVIGVWRKILPGCVVILGQISALVSGGPQCNYCFTTADKEILRYWPADHPVMFTVDQQSPAVLQHGGVQTLQLQDKHQVQQQLSQNKDYREMSRSRSRRWGRQRTSTLTTGSSGWRETSPGWRSSTARWWRRSTLRLTLSNTGTEVGCNTPTSQGQEQREFHQSHSDHSRATVPTDTWRWCRGGGSSRC